MRRPSGGNATDTAHLDDGSASRGAKQKRLRGPLDNEYVPFEYIMQIPLSVSRSLDGNRIATRSSWPWSVEYCEVFFNLKRAS